MTRKLTFYTSCTVFACFQNYYTHLTFENVPIKIMLYTSPDSRVLTLVQQWRTSASWPSCRVVATGWLQMLWLPIKKSDETVWWDGSARRRLIVTKPAALCSGVEGLGVGPHLRTTTDTCYTALTGAAERRVFLILLDYCLCYRVQCMKSDIKSTFPSPKTRFTLKYGNKQRHIP